MRKVRSIKPALQSGFSSLRHCSGTRGKACLLVLGTSLSRHFRSQCRLQTRQSIWVDGGIHQSDALPVLKKKKTYFSIVNLLINTYKHPALYMGLAWWAPNGTHNISNSIHLEGLGNAEAHIQADHQIDCLYLAIIGEEMYVSAP